MTTLDQSDAYYRSSPQVRPSFPDDAGEVHPRCAEMAETMRDLFAAGGGVRAKELVGAGFTWAEIVEFREQAAKIATQSSVRQVHARCDTMEDVVQKAREAIPNRPRCRAGWKPPRTRWCAGAAIAWPARR